MPFAGWEKIPLMVTEDNENSRNGTHSVEAIAPVIVSASRATDIPAFYADWFMHRLRKGYVQWTNPYSHRCQYVSFAKTRVIVFWSKDPRNLERFLPELDATGINYYFQFSLNDYEDEGLEPGIPPLDERIATFLRLADHVGRERVIWRFDPLLLSDSLTIDDLVERIKYIGSKIYRHTGKFIFSFIDIAEYKKVAKNLEKTGFTRVREFSVEEKMLFAKKMGEINKDWKIPICTCAEGIDLTSWNIRKGSCIDYDLMISQFSDDKRLMEFLNHRQPGTNRRENPARILKDHGQRKECGCILSKDIGQYNTCVHLCAYCYANHSETVVRNNYEHYRKQHSSGRFPAQIIPD